MNCVVGRNGSGKSNLFDAVQFVLGCPKFWSLRTVSFICVYCLLVVVFNIYLLGCIGGCVVLFFVGMGWCMSVNFMVVVRCTLAINLSLVCLRVVGIAL